MVRVAAQAVGRAQDQVEHLLQFLQVAAAVRRDVDAARRALQQAHAEFFLELDDLLADRRRRDVDFLRGDLDAAVPPDADEVAQRT
ncbi:hypothetical protein [Burkholderia glumae]|uniref:hypothetical protein n=1 Tax=Burkholderia glumae TaxID=337 RepID=UPI0030B838A0